VGGRTLRTSFLAAVALAAACGSKKAPAQGQAKVGGPDAGSIIAAKGAMPLPLPSRDEPRTDLRIGDHHIDEHDLIVDEGPGPDGHKVVECPIADKLDRDAALDRAAQAYEDGRFDLALACAERAGSIDPRSIEAHHNRGLALAATERWDEARVAFAHALAIDPDDPETLAGAADLYINRVPPSREMTEIGLEYARRGSQRVGGRRDHRELAARLAVLEAQAYDDLGMTDQAILRAEAAVALDPRNIDARYERAVILFHLCQFDRAREAFLEVFAMAPDDPYVHYHLALILEREGRQADADKLFARAHALAPDKFPDPALMPTPEEFQAMVDRAVADLPPHLKKAVEGVAIEVADVPALEDLLAVDPPFSPTILGLFRGPPLGETAVPGSSGGVPEPRSIVLYRKNLARAVGSRKELERQVRITLWHEVGHLRGHDEDDLRARGLE
jgi:tetratricopeptide (TPR) repeat protein